jgi:hydroxyacylglutathione hydrolase
LIKYKQFSLLPAFETNTWLVWDDETKQAILIDPSAPSEKLYKFIKDNNIDLKYVVNTHGHADHIAGNAFFKKHFNVPISIHAADADMLVNSKLNLSAYMEMDLALPAADRLLNDNDVISLESFSLQVIHTPGHTQGCICLYTKGLLFSGDTLFYLDIGRTDLPGGSYEQEINSVKTRLFTLPEDTFVFPGHGPSSLIKDEVLHNPYLKGL